MDSVQTRRALDRVWTIDAAVYDLRQDAAEILDRANRYAWQTVPAPVLELVRLSVASMIGNAAGLSRRSVAARDAGLTESKIAQLGQYLDAEDFTAAERACLTFAEQFVIDVSNLPESYVAALKTDFPGVDALAFAEALYVTECTQRLELMLPLLLGPSARTADSPDLEPDQAAPAGPDSAAALRQGLRDYADAVMRGDALDPVLTELVRLRCARTHNCQICQTLRLADARAAGADDAMTAKVDFYEASDLDERYKIALRITDAFITRPDTLSQATIEAARRAFTTEQLVELCLDITKWSTQKVYVSLGLDGAERLPTNADGVSFFSFSDSGAVAGYTAEAPAPADALR
jgi:alkylhydroperoxidase family enzyme